MDYPQRGEPGGDASDRGRFHRVLLAPRDSDPSLANRVSDAEDPPKHRPSLPRGTWVDRRQGERRGSGRMPIGAAGDRATATPVPEVNLTRRERQVVPLIAAGLTDRQIAETLAVSVRTAEEHVGRALRKLGLTRRELIVAHASDPTRFG